MQIRTNPIALSIVFITFFMILFYGGGLPPRLIISIIVPLLLR